MDISKAKLCSIVGDIYEEKILDFKKMTNRERQIVRLWANGHTSKSISEVLRISTNTVSTHRKNISRKIDVKSPKKLVLFALAFDML